MDLTHRFTVPISVDETWTVFQDIGSIAECFPGAVVTSFDGDSFEGSVKVKLGPIALVYNGSGTFVEKDEAAHRFVVDAKGKDKRGNGTAGAKVTVTMAASTDQGDGSTDVEVVTDLAITGKPAQFGRGVMQDVSDKLLGQFVDCLEQRLQGAGAVVPDVSGVVEPDPPPEGQGLPSQPEPDPEVVAAPPKHASAPPQMARAAPAAPAQDDSLNLGAAVLPVLAKTYWKQAAAVTVVVVFVIWWLVGRD